MLVCSLKYLITKSWRIDVEGEVWAEVGLGREIDMQAREMAHFGSPASSSVKEMEGFARDAAANQASSIPS